MSRHRELDELAGYVNRLSQMAPNQYTPAVKRQQTDLTTILQRMIQASEQDVGALPVPGGRRINEHDLRGGTEDPENLGPWPFRKGPEDYPEPNEG